MGWARAQDSISFTAASMWPLAFQSASNIGDLLGMRMYSTSCGTMSSSHLAPMKRAAAAGSRRAMSMDTPGKKDAHILRRTVRQGFPTDECWFPGQENPQAGDGTALQCGTDCTHRAQPAGRQPPGSINTLQGVSP